MRRLRRGMSVTVLMCVGLPTAALAQSELEEISTEATDIKHPEALQATADWVTGSAAGELRVGDRVRRGPDWKWDEQDGGSGRLGTVTRAPTSSEWARVEWDAGDTNTYRWGHEGAHDLEYLDGPGRPPPGGLAGSSSGDGMPGAGVRVGLRVQRGPDWQWEEQDGGQGGSGTVVGAPTESNWTRVRWDAGEVNDYRWGHEGARDLKIVAGKPAASTMPELIRAVDEPTGSASWGQTLQEVFIVCLLDTSPSTRD